MKLKPRILEEMMPMGVKESLFFDYICDLRGVESVDIFVMTPRCSAL
jgi:hypothetical protein